VLLSQFNSNASKEQVAQLLQRDRTVGWVSFVEDDILQPI